MKGEEEKRKLDFEETELRLGLPGGGRDHRHHDNTINIINANGKRDFSETVDLKLNLSSKQTMEIMNIPSDHNIKNSVKPPAAKAQVVGWPPVRSLRKNMVAAKSQKSSTTGAQDQENNGTSAANANLVKVSMDGAPYLRKVDLKMYNNYQQLSHAFAKLFMTSFTIGKCEVEGMKDFMNENKVMELLSSWDYVPTYEDKDGDWMLVGDVPWGMFVESCKRLRIMKGTEAIGLAPTAMEKYNRS